MDGPKILHGQDVVGLHQLREELGIGTHVLQGLVSSPGEAFAHLQMVLEIGFEFGGLLREVIRQLAELGDIPLFRPEGQVRHQARGVQQPHAALGEPFRRSVGEHGGELDHQVRPGLQRPLGPGELVRTGRFAPLDEVARHDHDAVGSAGLPLRLFEMVDVPVVQGIVLRDNAYDTHDGYAPLPQKEIYGFFSKISIPLFFHLW